MIEATLGCPPSRSSEALRRPVARLCLAVAGVLSAGSVFVGCGETTEPSRPATGSDLVLSIERDEVVWGLRADGRARRLTAGERADWSPGGDRLVFWRNDAVVTREVATGVERQIFRADPGQFQPDVRWAPRGENVALTYALGRLVDGFEGTPILAVLDVRTGVVTEVLRSYPDGPDIPFAWSADGSELAYLECGGVGPSAHFEYDCDLVRVDAAGRRPRRVRRGLSGGDPEWSPDGGAIAIATALRSGRDETDQIAGSGGVSRDRAGDRCDETSRQRLGQLLCMEPGWSMARVRDRRRIGREPERDPSSRPCGRFRSASLVLTARHLLQRPQLVERQRPDCGRDVEAQRSRGLGREPDRRSYRRPRGCRDLEGRAGPGCPLASARSRSGTVVQLPGETARRLRTVASRPGAAAARSRRRSPACPGERPQTRVSPQEREGARGETVGSPRK